MSRNKFNKKIRDTLRNRNVTPVILEDNMVYTRMNKETTPLNDNSI